MYQALFNISPTPTLLIELENEKIKIFDSNEAFCQWADCLNKPEENWPLVDAISARLDSTQQEELVHLVETVHRRGKTRFLNYIENTTSLEQIRIEVRSIEAQPNFLIIFFHSVQPSGNRLKYLLNTLPTCVIDINIEGKILGCNPYTLQTLGAKEYIDILGLNILNFFHESDRIVANEIIKHIHQYDRLDRELRIIDLLGNKKWLAITVVPVFSKSGELISILSIAKDVTEEKKAIKALKNEKESTQILINNVPALFFLFDRLGKLLMWNEYAETATGYSKEELENWTSIVELISTEDRMKVQKAIMDTFELGDNQIEAYLIHQQRNASPYLFKAKAIEFKGEPCIIGTGVNIHDRKEFEKALESKNISLKSANQELNAFASMVSHDLKEPLRMVKGFMDLLDRKHSEQLDTKGKQYVQIARDSAIKMQDLISEMLNYARLGTDGSKIVKFNPEKIIDEILILHQAVIEEIKAKIIIDPLPEIKASKTGIKIIFQNLISNALKYIEKNQKVEIIISCKEDHHFWIFSVKDNGIGVKKEDQEKIFHLFARTEDSKKYSGTGLGLATCRKIVGQHLGEIYVNSKEKHGSEFIFSIKKPIYDLI